jgi:hypothetical protein
MHIAEIGTVAKSLPLLRQRLINSSFKAILQIVAYFCKKVRGFSGQTHQNYSDKTAIFQIVRH